MGRDDDYYRDEQRREDQRQEDRRAEERRRALYRDLDRHEKHFRDDLDLWHRQNAIDRQSVLDDLRGGDLEQALRRLGLGSSTIIGNEVGVSARPKPHNETNPNTSEWNRLAVTKRSLSDELIRIVNEKANMARFTLPFDPLGLQRQIQQNRTYELENRKAEIERQLRDIQEQMDAISDQ